MTMLTPTRRQSLLLLCGLLMIAATLRVTFTGVAPLLEMIRASYGLTTAQTGLLTTLPLLAFAMVSPMVARIAGRYGMEKSLAGALILMMAGIAIRSLEGAGWLFTGTALIGCAIATGNVLLPGLIKRDFPGQVAKLTGAYSLTMGMAAALGSAFVVAGGGWSGMARRAIEHDDFSSVGTGYLADPVPPPCRGNTDGFRRVASPLALAIRQSLASDPVSGA